MKEFRRLKWIAVLSVAVVVAAVMTRRTMSPHACHEPLGEINSPNRVQRLSSGTVLQSSFSESLVAIEAESDSAQKEERLQQLIKSVPVSELPLAVQELQDSGSTTRNDIAAQLIRRWASFDVSAAAERSR